MIDDELKHSISGGRLDVVASSIVVTWYGIACLAPDLMSQQPVGGRD